jgi:hypothetical protein
MDCPACEAGFKAIPMTFSVDIPMNKDKADGPKRRPDIVRKAPNGGVYAYLRQRDRVNNRLEYQVVLISMSAWSYRLGELAPNQEFIRMQAQQYIGHVIRMGNKFFPVLPSGRLRRKGSSSLKKATYWLWDRRDR